MQEDNGQSGPSVVDIAHVLQANYAFISGMNCVHVSLVALNVTREHR